MNGLPPGNRSTYRPPMLTELNLERSTWQLIGALYGDRINHEQHDDSVEDMDLVVCAAPLVCLVGLLTCVRPFSPHPICQTRRQQIIYLSETVLCAKPR